MTEPEVDDPFLWDVDRVVQELCTTNRCWPAPAARKLPEPAVLEAVLRDQDVDGESLLTYGDVFGIEPFWNYLGIKKAPHRLSINAALQHFKKRSRKYREWERNRSATAASDDEANEPAPTPGLLNSASFQLPSGSIPVKQPASDSIATPALTPSVQIGSAAAVPPVNASLPKEASLPATLVGVKRAFDDTSTSDPATADKLVEEARPAKRRAALTNISAQPFHANSFAIPTEGDGLCQSVAVERLVEKGASPFAYLGAETIVARDILKPSKTVDDEREFCWTRNQNIPPGRRLQVAAALKRHLQRDPLVVEIVEPDDQEDEILPVYGESDGEESVDSETWEAYQKEKRQVEKRKSAFKPLNVAELVDRIIERLERRWISTKKPAKDRKARKLWDEARRGPYRQQLIDRYKVRQVELEKVIADKKRWMLSTEWESKEELESKVPEFLDLSVADLQYAKWYIALLESPHPPPKLEALPRAPRRRESVSKDSGEDDEVSIATDSADDGDADDWIEYDDEPAPDPMDIDSPSNVQPQSRSHSVTPELPTVPGPEPDQDLPLSPPTARKFKSEHTAAQATPRKVQALAGSEPVEIQSSPITGPNLTDLPGFHEPETIEQIGHDHWARQGDKERLVIAVLSSWPWPRKSLIFRAVKDHTPREVWDANILQWVENTTAKFVDVDVNTPSFGLMRLFDCYISCTADRHTRPRFKRVTLQRINREKDMFKRFCDLLLKVIPHLNPPTPQTPTRVKLITSRSKTPQEKLSASQADSDDDFEGINLEETSEEDQPLSSAKKRKRRLRRDSKAKEIRETNLEQMEEFDKKRRMLRQQLAESGQIPSDKTRLIVNETKEEGDELIYINDHIGSKIKDHQIEGVRFMWNHVVAKAKARQGCLLAHEMGLGKTMQAITLLVVIAEASCSDDPKVYKQIPDSLRTSKTLILCPPGLVDNWIDEILLWAPEKLLGPLFKFDSALGEHARVKTIEEWSENGGVVVAGYHIFTRLIEQGGATAELLEQTPRIVIADEAHLLKNPNSQRHQAAQNFKTMSRIALTGSPLTKHVMDYYSMINWVAPGFLADIAEFRQRFEKPIKDGLYSDSNSYQKRKARMMLHTLKEIVGPLVNRKDVHVLRETLPGKKEFILTLPLTKVQMKAYTAYLEALQNPIVGLEGQSKIWSFVSVLATLLAHPQIFKKTLEDRKKQGETSNNSDLEDDTAVLRHIPADLLSDTLATMSLKQIGDAIHSNKIRVLFAILDQCKLIGDKVLVFSQSLSTLDYLENAFRQQRRNFKRLDGSTPVGERQASVKQFNNDSDAEIYLISTKAGGIGLNINGANRVVIFDFLYTPAEEQQAIGRAYRIGQEKHVWVYWLTVGGTFEGAILNNAVFKTQLASRVVDKKNPDPKSIRHGEYFVQPTIPGQEDMSDVLGKDQVLDFLLTDPELQGAVRKVITTETFKEEEVYELPPEDRREAEEDIEIERLRTQNPEEYRRRDQQRNLRGRGDAATAWPRPAPAQMPLPIPQQMPPPMQNQMSQQMAYQAPPQGYPVPPLGYSMPDQSHPMPHQVSHPTPSPYAPLGAHLTGMAWTHSTSGLGATPPQAAGPSRSPNGPLVTTQAETPTAAQDDVLANKDSSKVNDPRLAEAKRGSPSPSPDQDVGKPASGIPSAPVFTGFLGSKSSLPANSPTGKEAELGPIRASGTYYKDGDQPYQRVVNTLHDSFDKIYQALQSAGRHPLDPGRLVEKICLEVDELGLVGLPRIQKMRDLNTAVDETPRLAVALLAGFYEPKAVLSFEKKDVLDRIQWLRTVDEKQFMSTVWKPQGAPELPPKREPPSNPRPKTTVTEQASAGPTDLKALRRALRERSASVPGKQQQHIARLGPFKSSTLDDQRRQSQLPRPGDTAESPHIID